MPIMSQICLIVVSQSFTRCAQKRIITKSQRAWNTNFAVARPPFTYLMSHSVLKTAKRTTNRQTNGLLQQFFSTRRSNCRSFAVASLKNADASKKRRYTYSCQSPICNALMMKSKITSNNVPSVLNNKDFVKEDVCSILLEEEAEGDDSHVKTMCLLLTLFLELCVRTNCSFPHGIQLIVMSCDCCSHSSSTTSCTDFPPYLQQLEKCHISCHICLPHDLPNSNTISWSEASILTSRLAVQPDAIVNKSLVAKLNSVPII